MASIGIILYIFTVIYISAGKANKAFVKLQCKTEHVGQHGQGSLLECAVKISQDVRDANIRVVTWKKEGIDEALLVFHRGQIKQQQGYSFAEPSWNDKNMNVSLLITNTAVRDEGVYTCTVMTNSGSDSNYISLKVTAKYSVPTIDSEPKMTLNTDGALVCNSDRGYPKGQLRWFDEHNIEWTVSAEMEAKQSINGLFHLTSKLTLLRGSVFPKYTCVVFNASGGKEDEATFEIPGTGVPDKYEDPALINPSSVLDSTAHPSIEGKEGTDKASKVVAPVVVIGSLIIGLLLVLLIYRRRSQQARRHSATPLMGNHHGINTSDVGEGDLQEMDKKCQYRLA